MRGQAAERPSFSVDLSLVHLTITVRDRQGQLVRDLRPEDFQVFEDGRPQAIQVFARAFDPGEDESLALDVGLLLDTSGSMLQELKLSQEAAVRFLDSVPRARQLTTVFFDQEIRVSRYDSEDQQGLYARILEAQGGGTTALYDAIVVGLSRLEGRQGRKVLVMFTDGEDSVSRMTQGDVFDLVRSHAVTIYPIAFGVGATRPGRSGLASAFLHDLARMTGGEVFSPTASREIGTIYARIIDELKSQYVLGYASDSTRSDGKLRKITVRTPRHSGLKIRHRTGYYSAVTR